MRNVSEQLRHIAKNSLRVGAVASIIASVSCGADANFSVQPTITPTPRVEPTPRSKYEYEVLIDTFYPELRQGGLKETGKVTLRSSNPLWRPTAVVNYTEYMLNADTTNAIYQVLESVTRKNPAIQIKFPINSEEKTFTLVRNNDVKTRTTILIPDNAQKPNYSGWQVKSLNLSEISGATIMDLGGNALSFIRVIEGNDDLFKTVGQKATHGFVIEACNQTMSAVLTEANAQTKNDLKAQITAREIGCISFGIAIAARAVNIPYEEYDEHTKNHPISVSSSDQTYFPISVDKESYNRFPVAGELLK